MGRRKGWQEGRRWQKKGTGRTGEQTARHNEPLLKCIIRCSRHLCGECGFFTPLSIHFPSFPKSSPISEPNPPLRATIVAQNTHTQSSFLSFLMVIPLLLLTFCPSLSICRLLSLSLSVPVSLSLSLTCSPSVCCFFLASFWWWSCCCRIIIAIRVRLNWAPLLPAARASSFPFTECPRFQLKRRVSLWFGHTALGQAMGRTLSEIL